MPKPVREVKRIVVRYQLKRVDDQLWAQAFDVGNQRFIEADFFGDSCLEVRAECTRRVNNCFTNETTKYNKKGLATKRS